MTRREKAVTLVLLWVGLGATAVFSVDAWWLRMLLALIGASVTAHVARLKTAVAMAVPAPGDAAS